MSCEDYSAWLHKVLLTMLMEQQTVTNPAVTNSAWFVCHKPLNQQCIVSQAHQTSSIAWERLSTWGERGNALLLSETLHPHTVYHLDKTVCCFKTDLFCT